MKGLEISKKFFEEYGKPMIESQFQDIKDKLAFGLVGEGSECFGLDDNVSQDHDFEPGFCIWMTREDADKYSFKLERAYAKLPKEFMGLKRTPLNPCGGNRHGVLIIEEFYQKLTGRVDSPTSWQEWMQMPEDTLATATNGEVFEDNLGVFSSIRQSLLSMPEDVKLKKISAKMIKMGMSGQYNYKRCIEHKDSLAAQLTLAEFVKDAISVIYLLNDKYAPYYKLSVRGMKKLEILNDLEQDFIFLLETDNTKDFALTKQVIIEEIAAKIIKVVKQRGLSDATCNNLDSHGYSIIDKIKDPDIRNLHPMQD